MTWKDYVIVALLQALVVALGLYWVRESYPPMAAYVQAVGRQLGAETVKALEGIDARLKALEAAKGAPK